MGEFGEAADFGTIVTDSHDIFLSALERSDPGEIASFSHPFIFISQNNRIVQRFADCRESVPLITFNDVQTFVSFG